MKNNCTNNIFIIGLTVSLIFVGCTKEEIIETTPVCEPIHNLTSEMKGTWKWTQTLMDTPDSSYYITSENSFEYIFTIDQEKRYKGYNNGELVHDFLISNKSGFNYSSSSYSFTIVGDCHQSFTLIPSFTYPTGQSFNSLTNTAYPFDIFIEDSTGITKSYFNSFVKI